MSVHTEDILKYPVTVPNIRNTESGIDFGDTSLGLLVPSGDTFLFEGEDGTFDPDKDFKRLFSKKYNFSYWNRGEMDYALDHLSKNEKKALAYTGKSGEISWIGPSTSIVLEGQTRGHPKKYLINLKNYVKKGWIPSSLDDLRDIISKLKTLQNLVNVNPVSVPLTQTNLILNELDNEFWWIRKLSRRPDLAPILKAWHEAYPARTEWNFLGTVKNLESFDQTKAYLSELMDMPSLDRDNILCTLSNRKFKDPNAHPGSLYIIETDIPEGLSNGPIPVKSYWPIGPIPRSNPVCKPFLDLLDYMGIPYKILWSYQIILKDLDKKPFRQVASQIWYLEEYYKAELAPIEIKNLHYTVTGHMLGLYYLIRKEEVEFEPGRFTPIWSPYEIQGTKDYNPPVACAVKAKVLCKTYKAYLDTKYPVAIREDNITGRGVNVRGNGFREKDSGTYLVISPNLRDLPGEDLFRHTIVDKFKSNTHFKLDRQYRNCVHGGDIHIPLGFPLCEEATCAFGNSYYRIPKIKGAMKGADMDQEWEQVPPTFDQIENGRLDKGKWVGEEWLESWILKHTKK